MHPHYIINQTIDPDGDTGNPGPTGPFHHMAYFAHEPLTITAANFDAQASRSDIPLAVDFWASWCGPFRQMPPAFAAAGRYLSPRVRLGKLYTEAQQAIAGR